MKALVLSAYYEPEVAASMYIPVNLYEDMATAGITVSVYTPVPTRGVDKTTRKAFTKRRLEVKCDGRLTIHRFPLFSEGKNPVLRTFRYLLLNLILMFKALPAKADIIFVQSTPPTQGAMAALLKIIKGIPFVYNVQDVFPDSLLSTKLTSPNSIMWKFGRLIENFTYRNASKMIVISDGFKANLMSKGVPEDKIDVVPNWVDASMVYPVDRNYNTLFDKYGLDRNKFYITHCGNLGLTQNIELLMEVALEFSSNDEIGFVLIGDGVARPMAEAMVAEKSLKNVRFIPFQPYEDIAQVFSLGDVGLVISKAGVGSSSVPSKTWSIMAAGRPVLASFDEDSELAMLLSNADCGLCVPANNKQALISAIRTMSNERHLAASRGARGRSYVLNVLSRKVGTSSYIRSIKAVVS